MRLQLNEKKSKENHTRLMSWYWKWKPNWNHPWIMFSFNWLVMIWRGGWWWRWGWWWWWWCVCVFVCVCVCVCVCVYIGCSFEIGRPRSRGWKSFGRRWTRGWEVLKIGQFSWTSYVYHPYSSLQFILLKMTRSIPLKWEISTIAVTLL